MHTRFEAHSFNALPITEIIGEGDAKKVGQYLSPWVCNKIRLTISGKVAIGVTMDAQNYHDVCI